MDIVCPKCGQRYELDKQYEGQKVECQVCKTEFIAKESLNSGAPPMRPIGNNAYTPVQPVQVVVNQPQPSKSRGLYIILALFFGLAGIHNFYAGYTGTGLIQLVLSLTGIGCIVTVPWVIIDILFTTKDGHGVRFG